MSVPFDKTAFAQKETYTVEDIFTLVRLLRSEDGCAWDRAQTHESVRKNLIEETYEVADGIDRDDPAALLEELGDYLFEGAFHIAIEEERARFTGEEVATALCRKMIARHPHVFCEGWEGDDGTSVAEWEAAKRREKGQKTLSDALDAVPRALPALMYAKKLASRAANFGFTYDSPEEAKGKVREEWEELAAATDDREKKEEFGDLLFALVNYGRMLGIDAEEALDAASQKFRNRLTQMEKKFTESGKILSECTKTELLEGWRKNKK